ncbi:hypothetical protein [Lysinibacillus fusiformis]|uniref:hypothetical protein n=1 Tax=Lysinibacillus fusiformis TaxID=28031 RepID=UPI003D07C674
MEALFKGQLTMDVYKIVESLEDEEATQNLVHEDITSILNCDISRRKRLSHS